jgi:hypothetical protein
VNINQYYQIIKQKLESNDYTTTSTREINPHLEAINYLQWEFMSDRKDPRIDRVFQDICIPYQVVFKNFCLKPEYIDKSSAINLLKSKIGIEKGDIKTLVTKPITTKNTYYNNYLLKIDVLKDVVYLSINNEPSDIYWKIDDIVKKCNNVNKSNISSSDISSYIEQGLLTVRFNVLKKDHGTKWTFNNKKIKEKNNFNFSNVSFEDFFNFMISVKN